MKKTTLPDFADKVVQVCLFGDNHCYAIYNPKFEKQRGRWFLVGIVPHGGTTSNWSEGATCAIAWDKVTDYLVFESAKHYQKARERFAKHS